MQMNSSIGTLSKGKKLSKKKTNGVFTEKLKKIYKKNLCIYAFENKIETKKQTKVKIFVFATKTCTNKITYPCN